MRRTEFQIEILGERMFTGYTDGRTWNGWAVPLFPFDQAMEIVEALTSFTDASYDELTDEFTFKDDEEEERFGPTTIEGRKLYGIGAGNWTWEEAECSKT